MDETAGAQTRPDRPDVFAFVTDSATEAALHDGLAPVCPTGLDIRRAKIGAAIAALRKMPSPRTLIVDVSEEEQPLTALDRLSEVVEPDIRVLLIGDRSDANFYRQVTRGLGVLEYMHKPLQRDMVARYFGPLIARQAPPSQTAVHAGRVVTITGVAGGVGASTLAANLAWYFGVEAARHTVLTDANLHRGICAMLLGGRAGPGLRVALETPQRIDELFVERAAQPVRDRLHLLAAEEPLSEHPATVAGAGARLLEALSRRYNFVLVDLPFSGLAMDREMLMMAHHRVLVMQPTLACVRDALRMLSLPAGPLQPGRAVLVLNRLGMPGGLSRRQIEDALRQRVDVVVPDMPKLVCQAATLGEPAVMARTAFRGGIIGLAGEIAVLRIIRDATLQDTERGTATPNVQAARGNHRVWSPGKVPVLSGALARRLFGAPRTLRATFDSRT
jgi:pilus assembly protein CpaE